MQDYHAEFVEIYNKNITRPGADRLLNWLETTDFFTAPASTRFHGACECGLVMHSINVYNAMMQQAADGVALGAFTLGEKMLHQRLQCDDAAFFHRG